MRTSTFKYKPCTSSEKNLKCLNVDIIHHYTVFLLNPMVLKLTNDELILHSRHWIPKWHNRYSYK